MNEDQEKKDRLRMLKEKSIQKKMYKLTRPEVLRSFKSGSWAWHNKRSDITDYFNFGLNECTLQLYIQKLDKLSELNVSLLQKQYQPQENLFKKAKTLFDNIPIDYGGFGKPFNQALITQEQLNVMDVVEKGAEQIIYENEEYHSKLVGILEREFESMEFSEVNFDRVVLYKGPLGPFNFDMSELAFNRSFSELDINKKEKKRRKKEKKERKEKKEKKKHKKNKKKHRQEKDGEEVAETENQEQDALEEELVEQRTEEKMAEENSHDHSGDIEEQPIEAAHFQISHLAEHEEEQKEPRQGQGRKTWRQIIADILHTQKRKTISKNR